MACRLRQEPAIHLRKSPEALREELDDLARGAQDETVRPHLCAGPLWQHGRGGRGGDFRIRPDAAEGDLRDPFGMGEGGVAGRGIRREIRRWKNAPTTRCVMPWGSRARWPDLRASLHRSDSPRRGPRHSAGAGDGSVTMARCGRGAFPDSRLQEGGNSGKGKR